MIDFFPATVDIIELDTRLRGQDESRGCLGAMTTMMAERVRDVLRRDLSLRLARPQIPPHKYSGVAGRVDGAGPNQVVDHKQVLGRTIPASQMLRLPEPLAGIGRVYTHSPIGTGE
jgi:hypothetical protein